MSSPAKRHSRHVNCVDKKRALFSDISTASRPLLFRMLEAVRFTDNVVPAPHSLDQLGEWGAKTRRSNGIGRSRWLRSEHTSSSYI